MMKGMGYRDDMKYRYAETKKHFGIFLGQTLQRSEVLNFFRPLPTPHRYVNRFLVDIIQKVYSLIFFMTHSQKIKIPRTKSPVNTNYQKSFTTFSAVFSTIFSIFDYFINLFRLFVYSTQFQVLYFVYFDDCKGSCDLLYYSHNRTANTTAAGKSPPRPLWDRSKASARGKSTGQARRGVQTRRNIEN